MGKVFPGGDSAGIVFSGNSSTGDNRVVRQLAPAGATGFEQLPLENAYFVGLQSAPGGREIAGLGGLSEKVRRQPTGLLNKSNSSGITSGEKPSLVGLLPAEIAGILKSRLAEKDPPAFRVNQIFRWICSGVSSFEEMRNLPLDLRQNLNDLFRVHSSGVSAELKDSGGTLKLQINLEDGNRVEAVMLRDGKGRKTACLSTQAGCPSGCVFCRTAKLGFKRNLTAGEIAEEFLLLNAAGNGRDKQDKNEKENGITHIVFMGMGEPLFNLENLRRAVDFLSCKDGINISKRRVTLSTCGIISGLKDFTENGPDIRLAVSLVSAREDLRQRLMPVTLTNPLDSLKKSLLDYQKKRRRRITLEAVLLSGVNTGEGDAEAMAGFAAGLDAVINLIPWNPVENPRSPSGGADGPPGESGPLLFEGLPLKTPPRREAAGFAEALEKKGLKVTWRFEKGGSISGACGQLGS